jgi:hypothetical protein
MYSTHKTPQAAHARRLHVLTQIYFILRFSSCFFYLWQDGATILIAAAQSGRKAIVELLLKHKANPSEAMQVSILVEITVCTLSFSVEAKFVCVTRVFSLVSLY